MIEIRKSEERGQADHGWLRSYHSFSFADYHDAEHMGFGHLRVINEDRIQPGTGFGTHGHRDMEIISLRAGGRARPQGQHGKRFDHRAGGRAAHERGKGVLHSEFNHAQDVTHFLQIWIEPRATGIPPSYEQKHFDAASKRGRLRLVASPDGRDGSVTIHQDAFVYAALLDGADRATHKLRPGRRAYLHVARGTLTANGQPLETGDALKATNAPEITLEKGERAEALLLDLA